MDDIASETDVTIEKFDVDDWQDLVSEWGVSSVPTVISVGEDGFEVARITGAKPKAVAMRELKI